MIYIMSIKQKNIGKRALAFSLAEVLLTIVIIGVLAVVLSPIISQGTGRHEILTKVNKANSVLNQAVMKIAYSEGLPIGDLSFIQEDGVVVFFEKFLKYVDTIKTCPGTAAGCFSTGQIKYLNGADAPGFNLAYSVITKDGLSYGWESSSCADKGLNSQDLLNCIGSFVVDINGHRPPNRYGYDIFFFTVVDTKGIVPAGKFNKSTCKRDDTGITCASKVIDDQGVNYK